MFGEQQSEPLVRLPTPSVLSVHAQAAAQRRNLDVVVGEAVRGNPSLVRVQVERLRIFALPAGGEAGRNLSQPLKHGGEVVVAERATEKAVQDEAAF